MSGRHLFAILAVCAPLFSVPAIGQQTENGTGYHLEPGPPGRAGTEAADQDLGMALLSASLFLCSTLTAGSGVVSFNSPKTGDCDVTFNRDVTDCTCTATFGTNGGAALSSQQNFIAANCGTGGDANVRVSTILNGASTDFAFHLIVFCPK